MTEPDEPHGGDREPKWVRKFLEEALRPASAKTVTGKRPAPKKGGKKK